MRYPDLLGARAAVIWTHRCSNCTGAISSGWADRWQRSSAPRWRRLDIAAVQSATPSWLRCWGAIEPVRAAPFARQVIWPEGDGQARPDLLGAPFRRRLAT